MTLNASSSMLAALLLSFSASQAASVSIFNHSFELPDRAPGFGGEPGLGHATHGWIETGSGGLVDTTGQGRMVDTPDTDGNQALALNNGAAMAFLDSTYSPIASTVTLQANTIYTLTFDVGDRNDLNFGGGEIRLGYGGTGIAADIGTNLLTATSVTNPTPGNGDWATWTSTFETGAAPAGLGQALRIEFAVSGVQTVFDNVRLDASPVPEPSIAILSALGSLLLLRRRR